MGTAVFWLILIGLLVIIAVSGIRREKELKRHKLLKLRQDFGKAQNVQGDAVPNIKNLEGYYRYIRSKGEDDSFFIDDITFNDLSLDKIYLKMAGTLSSAGDEYLYSHLRSLNTGASQNESLIDVGERLCSDEETRLKAQEALLTLGKLKNVGVFDILSSLFEAENKSIVKDVCCDIFLILSIFAIFYSPGIGFLAFMALLILSVSTYFKGRKEMDDNLSAFSYVLRMIRCENALKNVYGRSEEQLFSDDISELLKGEILLPKRNGTTSNPLSIILDYVRMIFHVDIILYRIRLGRIIEKKERIISMYECIGCIDAAIAVYSYALSLPHFCRAQLCGDEKCFIMKEGFHPLVGSPVCNDFEASRGALITGSNASGKSTFLKTVGISVVFAEAFGFAPASSLKLHPACLYTSMALNDNILNDESYYVVESKSLKRICDAAEGDRWVIALIDEVLRGTNTIERIAASSSILKYIADKGAMCIAATHDAELADILREELDDYFFTENVNENTVVFPFKINKGISQTHNAIKLLETLGYDGSIIEESGEKAAYYIKNGKWV